MRMRKKKNLDVRMQRCADWLVEAPEQLRGHWRGRLPGAEELRLELGCGKGRFTVETAARHPKALFVAIERVPDALITAMECARERGLSNVLFICGDAADLEKMFAPGEVDLLYINFCDPWPSKRHAKRRLTYEAFLREYRAILRDGAEIHFKTDNRPLFEFSLTQFPRAGYALTQVTRDLHREEPDAVMTDFEAVFHAQGVPINRCVGVLGPIPAQLPPEPKLSLLDYWQEGDPVPRGMDRHVEQYLADKRRAARNEENS